MILGFFSFIVVYNFRIIFRMDIRDKDCYYRGKM